MSKDQKKRKQDISGEKKKTDKIMTKNYDESE